SLAAISPISLGGFPLAGGLTLDHAEDVGLLHDDELLAIDFDLAARPLAEQDAVARLHVERMDLAILGAQARADGHDFALLGLLLGGIGNDDPARGLLLLLQATDQDAVLQGPELHENSSRWDADQHPGRSPLLALTPSECQGDKEMIITCQEEG